MEKKQDKKKTCNPFEVVSQALTAFVGYEERMLAGGKASEIDEERRAVELIGKVLGEWAAVAHRSDELAPTFYIDYMVLEFTAGATPEDDFYMATFLGEKSFIPIRSFPALGNALNECLLMIENKSGLE